MRILIVSDTHGRRGGFDAAVKEAGQCDLLIHLGDVTGDEEYIEAVAGCPAYIVAGNNDFLSGLSREEEISVAGHRIFITHGHYYYVGLNEERLEQEARARGADIVMYGHTHIPIYYKKDGLVILNPGSLSYPRQLGRKPSYMTMELEPGKEPKVELHYVS